MSAKGKLGFFFLIVFNFLILGSSYAQWTYSNTSSWLNDKYSQPLVKISISKKGILKIPFSSLPSDFPVQDPSKFQLWHRGNQVDIISTTNNEIIFYGIPNDGKTDELLFRSNFSKPDTNARTNPYVSRYSDESAYFLTVSTVSGNRAATISKAFDAGIGSEKYHLRTDLTTFTEQYSHSPQINFLTLFLVNSFFENGKGPSSKMYGVNPAGTNSYLNAEPVFTLPVVNLYKDEKVKPEIELLLYGRTTSSNSIAIQVGKSVDALRKIDGNVEIQGFGGSKKSFFLNASTDVINSDASTDGKVVLKLTSNKVTNDYNTTGIYSVTFFKLTYPQLFDMKGSGSSIFNLPPGSASLTRVSIHNSPSNSTVYDITDVRSPKIISSNIINGVLEIMIPRTSNKALSLLVSNEAPVVVSSNKVSIVKLSPIEPANYDYLIVTNDKLKQESEKYADYRRSIDGGSFKPYVANISDIYNQFNYGEPSPVAIRRFVDFMLSKGIRSKHNLVLIGHCISNGDSINNSKELRGMVPTVGFPGSDLLLVSGLAGSDNDVPAIPVGRISAFTIQHVRNYLSKVKEYEENANGDIGWKKEILHLSGGKSASEIIQLKTALSTLSPVVTSGVIGGNVSVFEKQSVVEVEKVNIAPAVNKGAGMVSYFGHGSTTITDLDMGYVSDASRGYQNKNKYPFMFFNGCGVGNIFRGNLNEDITAGDREPLTLDWMYAKDKGAIAVIANSYYSFLSPSSNYVTKLYQRIFNDPEKSQYTIGQIQRDLAQQITKENFTEYDIANLHQSVLQGDPALHLIRVSDPDYAIDAEKGIGLYSESKGKTIGQSSNLRVAVALSNKGKYTKDENVPVQIKYIYSDASVQNTTKTVLSMAYRDTIFFSIPNLKPLQRIEVKIDAENVLKEFSKTNNYSELDIDWNQANGQEIYFGSHITDNIPPILDVRFNDKILKNNETIKQNSFISINLVDDRVLSSDTTLVEMFIKPCNDEACVFEKVYYSNKDVEFSLVDSKSIEINYDLKLLPAGEYELLVNSKDKSGNANSQSYRVRFKISKDLVALSVVASPNPASDYVRFELSDLNGDLKKSIEFRVYDSKGANVENINLVSGMDLWYWKPKTPSGIYVYKIFIRRDSGKVEVLDGKLLLVR